MKFKIKPLALTCSLLLGATFSINTLAAPALVGGIQETTFLAGQTTDVGSVTTEVVGDNLVITFTTTGDWTLAETHLWVGDNIADMPQTKKGNPKIGNFPYQSGDLSGTGTIIHVETIPLNVLGFSCPSADSTYHTAAHAAVELVNSTTGEVIQSETAWSDGTRYVERGAWGTYESFTLTCPKGAGDPPPVAYECETAYAYDDTNNNGQSLDANDDNDDPEGYSNNFLTLDLDGNGEGDFNRWGWSNGALSAGTYSFDVYGGAGQSDITKGVLAGELTVDYDGAIAIVTYTMNEGFTLEEAQVYAGSEILPTDSNGNYTVAPGQYGNIHNDLDHATTDTFTIGGLSGDIYVVPHANVCQVVSDPE